MPKKTPLAPFPSPTVARNVARAPLPLCNFLPTPVAPKMGRLLIAVGSGVEVSREHDSDTASGQLDLGDLGRHGLKTGTGREIR